ncbi:manganese-dependent inorganic pyrophosphatase [Alkalibacterium putridalgicola]|uniref:Probable manganese-dependent inorganic pyrophosphatase n=1 Tax=Alkalibacterium putridalgicola TaxID=426703 RepID=A0A1H7X6K9_9LACT|nr:manganese-dependent inorganic pyrophosphatase [Alkalibacterium putridalgicola]GEK90272.1 putative manganese-dependent inorganic pyrophosphatase [Alkalibacterium putridalgicola]SEM28768.1 manganese-dependent inorganic pyrophosphatase [Alkalibacterium putridalgicola]
MSKILIFGHQSPDTDAITSAITFSYLQNALGKETEAVALGKTTAETQYALDYFEVETPRVVTTVAQETPEVMLVDHNEAQQSVPDIEKVKVLAVVDHHRIANFQTANPLYYRAEPVGCTNTIILKMFKENNIDVPKHIAGLMLSAIISDTLLLKSPTCTQEDVKAAEELAETAGVDLEAYGKELLKAGTDTSSKTADMILNDDAKNFPMGGLTVRIGQVNVVDVDDILNRKQELLEEMAEQCTNNEIDLFILVTTDVLNSNSVALVYGEEKAQVAQAFNKELKDDTLMLEGVVSRKKQVVPPLTVKFG